jgi:predicted amidohydrolase YtcJ
VKRLPSGFLLAAAAMLLSFGCSGSSGGTMAELVLINGKVWTGVPGRPWAEAVAVSDGRIEKVGTTAEVSGLAGKKTEVVDLEGSLVLPGFIDSHTHFLAGGFALRSIKLREARSREEFVEKIAAKARGTAEGEWILNGDWDHENFDPPELPRKEWIDAVTPANPVCLNPLDGHMVLANSLALRIAGITKDTPVPAGGEIVRDPETGEPTGILKDTAMDLVYDKIPEPSFEEKLQAAEASLRHAAENGVTSVHEMADESSYEVFAELGRRNKLTARISVYIPITEVERFPGLKSGSAHESPYLRLAGLKGFVDGSLGSATALFFEPYTDDPRTRGLLHGQMFPEGIMEKRILEADRAGLQVAVHAIGDRANSLLLDIYEKARSENGPRDRRWRIEHAQHLRPEDIPRFGRLGVVASVQPYHAIDDGRWAEKKIGPERVRTTYAFRSLLESGAVLAFGSDWTVAPLDPLAGIFAAVTRRTLDGKFPEGWNPEEKIGVEEAVKGYTTNGAYTDFSEGTKGAIDEGKVADLVVVDRDIFTIPPEEIEKAGVLMTVFDGRIIYRNDGRS